MQARAHNTVFVVDDVKVNRAILSSLVRRLGFECEEFESGAEALTAFEQMTRSGEPIAAIIMDINMPGMDGLEAAWRIRNIEAFQRQLCGCQDDGVPSLSGPSKAYTDFSLADASSGFSSCEMREMCKQCKASQTPIWAVSACSPQEQAKSPIMRLLSSSKDEPPWKLAGFDAFMPKPVQPVQLKNMLQSRRREEDQASISPQSACNLFKPLKPLSMQASNCKTATTSEVECVPSRPSMCKITAYPKVQTVGTNSDASTIDDDSSIVPELCG